MLSVISFLKMNQSLFKVIFFNNSEVKHDVYDRRQTAKITSDYLLFSCNFFSIVISFLFLCDLFKNYS